MNVIENFSKGGFVGQIQPNSLVHADCLEAMKYIEPKSIDMIFADLPYGKTSCKWDIVIPFEPLWEQYTRLIKENGAIVLTGSQPFTSILICSNLKMFRYEWIWKKAYKTLHPRASFRPLLEHENILVFYKKQPTYNAQGLIPCNTIINQKLGTLNDTSVYAHNSNFKDREIYTKKFKNFPSTVVSLGKHINARKTKHLHPTQKDVEMIEYFIKTYTNEGETILDNCMGSGSTGVACLNTKRNFIGIEKDDKYFNIASKRIRDAEIDKTMRLL